MQVFSMEIASRFFFVGDDRGFLLHLYELIKQSAVMVYQIQTQLSEKVSHLEANTSTRLICTLRSDLKGSL